MHFPLLQSKAEWRQARIWITMDRHKGWGGWVSGRSSCWTEQTAAGGSRCPGSPSATTKLQIHGLGKCAGCVWGVGVGEGWGGGGGRLIMLIYKHGTSATVLLWSVLQCFNSPWQQTTHAPFLYDWNKWPSIKGHSRPTARKIKYRVFALLISPVTWMCLTYITGYSVTFLMT